MHIPDDPLYYEKYYFTPGDLGFQAVDTAVGRVGTLVCWDQWYPEGARLTALQGAEVLFYPTAIGWHPAEKEEFGAAQYDAWQTIQRAHAIANGVYVAGVNRVGHEQGDVLGNRAAGPGLEFWGGSFLADPFGRIIAKASHDEEEILHRRNRPRRCLKTRAATGRSCATAASTPTRRSPSAFSIPVHAWAPTESQVEMSTRPPAATPRELGYRMPAEWERHEATWLAWPHNPEDWPGKFQAIPWLYAEIVRLLAARERVHLLVQDDKEQQPRDQRSCERAGANLDQVSFHQWPTDRVWTRDSGPIFVRNPRRPGRHHQLALQCLGQVCRLASRRPDSRPRGGTARTCPNGSRLIDLAGERAPAGARRRLDRHQWRRASCSPPKSAC